MTFGTIIKAIGIALGVYAVKETVVEAKKYERKHKLLYRFKKFVFS